MLRLFLIATILSAHTTAYAESFLCVADMAAGFAFNKSTKEWRFAKFNVSGQKYVIRHVEKKDYQGTAAWVVMKLGQDFPDAWCENDFNGGGNLYCNSIGGYFKFNKKNLRYLSTYTIGYWSDDLSGAEKMFAEGKNTPAIEIGKCSPI